MVEVVVLSFLIRIKQTYRDQEFYTHFPPMALMAPFNIANGLGVHEAPTLFEVQGDEF